MLRTTTAIVFAVVVAASFAFAQQQGDGKNDESLSVLVQEREQAMQKLVDIARIMYEQGDETFDSLIAAESNLLDVQLESATTAPERIAVLESKLRIAKRHETLIAERVKNAGSSQKDLLTAKANRLTAQIALLREKQKK